MRPSQYLLLPPKICPPFPPIYMCDHPRIYPSLPEYTPFSTRICDVPRIYPSFPEYTPFSTNAYVLPSLNLPVPPRLYPPFQQLYATLPKSTPPSPNIRIYHLYQSIYMCDPHRIFWEGGVHSGRIAHTHLLKRGGSFWEGGVDSERLAKTSYYQQFFIDDLTLL